MATDESQRGALEKRADIPEGQRRLLWGLVGVLIAVVLFFRFPLTVHVLEPEWLSKGLGLGLILGAYLGWRRGGDAMSTLPAAWRSSR
jgi:hypothetical protein